MLQSKFLKSLITDRFCDHYYSQDTFTKAVMYANRSNNLIKIRFPQRLRILGTSTKIEKNKKLGKLGAVLYLAPHKESEVYGGKNLCPNASVGCSKACLGHTSGRLRMSTGYHAKAWKTLTLTYVPNIFIDLLRSDIQRHIKRAKKLRLKPCVRLNGSSDIAWEILFPKNIFDIFPKVSFYDYTKSLLRYKTFLNGKFPPNYHLTFSRSESNESECLEVLKSGGNVAVVFSNLHNAMMRGWNGYPVINGDYTDYRPNDPKNVVVGLSVKGNIKDTSGFVVCTK